MTLAEGSAVRVLARYPERKPRFAEVEIDGRFVVTLPILLTSDVALDCGCA